MITAARMLVVLVVLAGLTAGISAQEPDALQQAQRSAAARIAPHTHLLDWEVWSHLEDDKWQDQRTTGA